MHTVSSFIDYCIPAERIEWTWKPGKFTLGDSIRHLATIERDMYAENVMQRPSMYRGHGRELAEGYDSVRAFLRENHRQSLEIFTGLADEDMERKCVTPGGASLKTWKWLRAMTEHEIHHRGQIYVYLAMLDIPTPPLYGLTSEELRARSKS